MVQDAQERGREIEREREEMTKDMGIEKGKENDGQRGRKKKKKKTLYVTIRSIQFWQQILDFKILILP